MPALIGDARDFDLVFWIAFDEPVQVRVFLQPSEQVFRFGLPRRVNVDRKPELVFAVTRFGNIFTRLALGFGSGIALFSIPRNVLVQNLPLRLVGAVAVRGLHGKTGVLCGEHHFLPFGIHARVELLAVFQREQRRHIIVRYGVRAVDEHQRPNMPLRKRRFHIGHRRLGCLCLRSA